MSEKMTDAASGDFIPADVRQTVVSQVLPQAQIGVSRLRSFRRNMGLTAPYQLEDADLVVLQLRPFGEQQLWVDGRPAPFVPYDAGTVTVHDLDRNWVADLQGSFDCLHFHLPRQTLEEVADEIGGRRKPRLFLPPHLSVRDPVIHGLGQALLPALAEPERASQLFIDHLVLAFQAHMAHQYGGAMADRRRVTGRLAAWQELRAKEFLIQHLDSNVSVADVARECGLSRNYFLRAFRETTGLPPHRWLLNQRIERAKVLLLNKELPLGTVAQLCGFADQSHLTRTFSKVMGVSPGRWRLETGR
ncbi:helix-turn-helix domain-containing protein [Burkholderia ubonensis]|uniref:helix-turn-helix domain-containing protein n=1 Tax=Burkholderia ubonensis TaxID=101571 RepID=UPI00075DDA9A|nr:AraC family transcriptional regulator [Burkholderia ubonensis]KVA22917.1 AraC family transcriptional regulator [Burkholderia ubonensis]KVA27703.1 AraC family transcriptional regulator [Burkholderia ubonensis]KVA44316.1 AraC family transcriptional regulator [Burkholderia ubonensis]